MLELVVKNCILYITHNSEVTDISNIKFKILNYVKDLNRLDNEPMLENKYKIGNKIQCGTRCLIVATILIKRLIKNGVVVSNDNINNIITTSMILSFKMTEDYEHDELFQDTFNLSSELLLEYEIEFLTKLGYNLFINKNEYNKTLITILNPVLNNPINCC